MAESDRKPAEGTKKPLSWTITPVDPKGGMIGATLRVARGERGLSIDDVAAVLKIRREHIASIESGRIDDLPGLPYAIGFVRTYAEYLGMDGLEAVRRFKEEVVKPKDEGELVFPIPVSDRKFPTALLIAGPVILAAAIYGAWYFYLGDDAATADAPATPATETTAESSTEAGPAADAASQPATDAASQPEAAADPVAAAPAAPAPAAPAPVGQSAAESEAAPERLAETEAEPASPAEPADVEAAPAASPAPAAATPDDDSSTVEAATESAATAAGEEQPASSGSAETEAPATESEASALPSAAPPLPPIEEVEAVSASPAIPAAEGPAVPPEAAPAQESETESGTASATQEAALPISGQGTPGPSRIELRATSDSWVVIRDAQSKVLFARILGVGESYSVPSLPNLSMVTGNAGALDIYVDGQIIKPLGPIGAVRRDIALDPDKLLAGQ